MRSPSAPSTKAFCRRSKARMLFSARGALRKKNPGALVLIGCSGRGDKDMPILQKTLLKELR